MRIIDDITNFIFLEDISPECPMEEGNFTEEKHSTEERRSMEKYRSIAPGRKENPAAPIRSFRNGQRSFGKRDTPLISCRRANIP